MNPPPTCSESDRARPDRLPVLALRENVVFPLTLAPVSVESARARHLVEGGPRGDRLALLVAQREGDMRPPRPEHLYAFGTAGLVHEAIKGPDSTLRIAVQGIERVRIVGWAQTEPHLVARIAWLPDVVEPGLELDALLRAARRLFKRLVALMADLSIGLASTMDRIGDPRQLVYFLASTAPMTIEARQQVLEQPSVAAKLRRIIVQLQHDIAVRELLQKIAAGDPADAAAPEREASARKQSRASRGEASGDGSADVVEAREMRSLLAELALPEDARKEADRELSRLERTPSSSPEHGMIRTYLDWLAKMPWGKLTTGAIDVSHARHILECDHYALGRVKERIVEYLAVRRLREERSGRGGTGEAPGEAAHRDRSAREPILCFVGPPGVGKTSLGRSIARALGRSFVRIAIGGVHDEAEIRGHRRTYLGAMPGRILQALARSGAADPVFMLDEIDKLGVGIHGDPSAALLEVLDPAQNHAFVDSYLGVGFDLSRVLFVCTANTTDTIAAPLLDRMEVVTLAGYTEPEKVFIARHHLLPKAIEAHGLLASEVAIGDDAVRRVVRGYTREAGVRSLDRELAGVLRKVACHVTEGAKSPILVRDVDVSNYLGSAWVEESLAERIDRPGVATGLAWMPTGGDILHVEAAIVDGDHDRLLLTGMLGNVMRESAQAALSYLRSNAARFGIDPRALVRKLVHVHVPAGAIPKDGPSAGITILSALASSASGRVVRSDVAMTGEITLRGRVLPVAGIKEKVLAAHRAGMRVVVLPRRCEAQLSEVPTDVQTALRFVPVDSAEEVLAVTLYPWVGANASERSPQPLAEPAPVSVH